MKYYCDTEDCPHDCGFKECENPKQTVFICQNTGKLIIMESEVERKTNE